MSSEGNEIRATQNKIVKVLTTSKSHPIRIGPAGWSYTDWEGSVYPPHGSRFDPLAYLASFFDTIEINSPFYRIPPPTHPRSWIRRVENNPDFKFTTKVFRGVLRRVLEAPWILKKNSSEAFRVAKWIEVIAKCF